VSGTGPGTGTGSGSGSEADADADADPAVESVQPDRRRAPAIDRLRALAGTSRPDQLLLMVVVYGAGAAAGSVLASPAPGGSAGPDPVVVLVGYLAFLPLAASVHYANEYADYWTDRLADRTPFSGGSGELLRAGVGRGLALRAAIASLAVGVVGVVVAWRVGPLGVEAVALLAVIVVLGWGYSVPPLALAWRGVGEVDNALLGGVVLPTYGVVVVTGRITVDAVAAFVPFGCLVFANLLATTWPDRLPDATVGKRTLATRLDPAALRRLYWLGVAAALGSVVVVAPVVPPVVSSAQAIAVLPFVAAGRRFTRQHSPFPTVAAMVAFAIVQLLAWGGVALGAIGV
jgi:1,4-dihydroxy-2-naphthoate octaprenyltransferase